MFFRKTFLFFHYFWSSVIEDNDVFRLLEDRLFMPYSCVPGLNKTENVRINLISRRVRVTIIAAEKQ